MLFGGIPPRESMLFHQHRSYLSSLVFWNEKSVNLLIFYFCDLFHVSIVEFEVDFRKTVRFACVISELVGGLPDLA